MQAESAEQVNIHQNDPGFQVGIGSTFVNHNDYPREVFFEALVRYIEEDLARRVSTWRHPSRTRIRTAV